jgi:hypothetical protein
LSCIRAVVSFAAILHFYIKAIKQPSLIQNTQFGLLISRAITILYEPPNKQQKDSVLSAEIYVSLGVISILINPMQSTLFNTIGIGGKIIKHICAYHLVTLFTRKWDGLMTHSTSRMFFVHFSI